MSKIDHALAEFREMDEFSARSSRVHAVHPLIKLLVTIYYIMLVVSFDKYEFSRLITLGIYPILLFQISGSSMKAFFYKMRFVLPPICAVGLFNPLFDRTIQLYLGNLPITGGWISLFTLLIKGLFCLMASYILIATTRFDSLCAALRRIHVPSILVTLLLLTYRYVTMMMEEVSVMTTAYKLRAPGQKGIHFKAWGSFLGQLLLRSMDRAEEIYAAMQLRGFHNEYPYAFVAPLRITDFAYLLLSVAVTLPLKFFNVAELIGKLVI